jgi:hypothetical protein
MRKRTFLPASLFLAIGGLALFAGLPSLPSTPPAPIDAPDGAAHAKGPKPDKDPFHQVVRVTGPAARRPAEVSVAINPTLPDHIVAVSHQTGKPGEPASNHCYVSADWGRTWKTVACPNPDRRIQGDDAIGFGPDGTAHRTYIAFQGIRTRRPLRAVTGIFTSASRDGLEWSPPVPVLDHINSVQPFEDKPLLGIDTSADSPHRGNLYVAWTRFDVYGSRDRAYKSHIYFSRSRDGGRSFSPPWRISDKAGNAADDSGTVEGAMPAIGPRGEVYVTWAGPLGIVFKKSTDGGWSFGADRVIAKYSPPAKGKGEGGRGWSLPAPGVPRHNGMPVLGVDLSHGPKRGSIYVNWIDKRHGDLDVFAIASRDGGATWSDPVRVNDDKMGNGKDQLFTWMAVDPVDGSVNAFFYDRRDLKGTLTGLTLARSVDGGRTFVNYRVQQEPFPCYPDVFMGDYIGVAAHSGRVVGMYSHFIGRKQLAISAALFRFRPGTQKPWSEE